jgi:hypothetical protein
MDEGKGLHVFNYAARGGQPESLGLLELGNVDWVVDSGRPALRFADNPEGRKDYPREGVLHRTYLAHPGYAGRDTVPVAVTGTHGGGREWKAFTLAAWIKPAAQMGKAEHGGKGDIAGLGARRVILRLVGARAPYQLAAALNVNDVFVAPVKLEAERWYHVALTGEPTEGGKWQVRLYVDGKRVHERVTKQLAAPASWPSSLILGAELFYFHDAYYRGLIGRTLVFDRALTEEELGRLR